MDTRSTNGRCLATLSPDQPYNGSRDCGSATHDKASNVCVAKARLPRIRIRIVHSARSVVGVLACLVRQAREDASNCDEADADAYGGDAADPQRPAGIDVNDRWRVRCCGRRRRRMRRLGAGRRHICPLLLRRRRHRADQRLLTMAQRANVKIEKFGDATGTFSEA